MCVRMCVCVLIYVLMSLFCPLLQYPESSSTVSDLLSYLQPLVKVSMKLVHKEVVKMKVCLGRSLE